MAIPMAYATASAGMHPSHTLPMKLRAIAQAKFEWTEVAMPDLEAYASSKYEDYRHLDVSGEGDLEKLVEATSEIHALCVELGLQVLTVMPFSQFEGYVDEEKLSRGLKRARAWFRVLKALDCQMLQVGSSNDPQITSDFSRMAADLQLLADEAAKQDPPIKIAYEMWAWGTYVNTWEHTWDICKRVDRPNFGLCLDTFQISAVYYATTVALSSDLETSLPLPAPSLEISLKNLTETLSQNLSKIFYAQISDGSRVDPNQLSQEAKDKGIHALYAWSNSYRPLPFQQGKESFLPVIEVMRAILATGWIGPWSYEVFLTSDQDRDDPNIPYFWTCEAVRSHLTILGKLKSERSAK
ncbi:xylose isomerase-like protein [Schizopora paradoxa]|uniref:Xylose isomerase-like protein n=1 Tax=Schizopora paradoxa TaxID=27342 RepID=A0A0H2RZF0_9AGAM|nr:xylose isomerase-like protein [Schizopora paradoxa]